MTRARLGSLQDSIVLVRRIRTNGTQCIHLITSSGKGGNALRISRFQIFNAPDVRSPIATLNTRVHAVHRGSAYSLHLNFNLATANIDCRSSDRGSNGCEHTLAGPAVAVSKGDCALISFNTIISGGGSDVLALRSNADRIIPTVGLCTIGDATVACATIMGAVPRRR